MIERACPVCKKQFLTQASYISRGRGKHCSVICKGVASRNPRATRVDAVQCSDGSWAFLSPEDTDLRALAWSVHPKGYPMRNEGGISIRMHRLIMERMLGRSLKIGEIVDHEDRNPRNNRRGNLRLADNALNTANAKYGSGKYPFKGGIYQCSRFKFTSRITVGGKRYNLGTFDTPEEAANMYDQYASQIWEGFAYLNFDYY